MQFSYHKFLLYLNICLVGKEIQVYTAQFLKQVTPSYWGLDWGHPINLKATQFLERFYVLFLYDYGLDDRAIDVRSPAEAKGFFL
jgi:hypothetical protein